MREILLIIIVAGISAAGLLAPIISLFGYIWFALMRPDILAWSRRPYSLTLALVTLAVSWRYLMNFPNLILNPISRLLLLQQIPIGLSVIFAYRMSLSTPMYERYMRLIVIVLLIPVMVTTAGWFRALYFLMVFSMGAIAVKFGMWSAMYGGVQLVVGYTGMYADSNGISLAMGILVPLAVYGRELTSHFLVKMACLGIAACGVITIVMTGSRGNMLALGCICLLMLWRSKYKVVGAFMVALMILPAVYLAGDRLGERLESITNYDQDASASSRLNQWIAALKMSRDYPVFGVGYGEKNYTALASRYLGHTDNLVVHNSYLQMLVDTGVFGFVLYTGTWLWAIVWLGFSARRMKRLKPQWWAYPVGLQTGLIHFALGSFFYSRSDFEFAYIVLMAVAAWYAIEKQALRELAFTPPVRVPAVVAARPEIASAHLSGLSARR